MKSRIVTLLVVGLGVGACGTEPAASVPADASAEALPAGGSSWWWESVPDGFVCGLSSEYDGSIDEESVAEALTTHPDFGASSPEQVVDRYANSINVWWGTPDETDSGAFSRDAFVALSHALDDGSLSGVAETDERGIEHVVFDHEPSRSRLVVYEVGGRWFPLEAEWPVPCLPYDVSLDDPERDELLRIEVSPQPVRPGDEVTLAVPDDLEWGDLFRVDRRYGDEWRQVAWLVADDESGLQWHPWVEASSPPTALHHLPGQIAQSMVIPSDTIDGDYLVCLDDPGRPDYLCGDLEVVRLS